MANNPESVDDAPVNDSDRSTNADVTEPTSDFFSSVPNLWSQRPSRPPMASRPRPVTPTYHTAPSSSLPNPISDASLPTGLADAEEGDELAEEISPLASRPRLWEKQPYNYLAHLAAVAGSLTGGWLFGILVAQVLPGSFAQPPLQEAMLRKSSRLAQRLWHFPQLWQTPTAQTRIEAIPLPETGPVLAPVNLPPIERQPLIDELNAIETEIITLDRRLQAIEKQLGKPPYQGADIDNRLNSLRHAIDPPLRTQVEPAYTPVPQDPAETLLDVAKLRITLPSDALFSPGQAQIKEAALLNQVLDQLVNYPEATILIRSYTDNQANAIDSRKYTLKQANALSTYLQATLPSTHRWITIGAGQSQPVASNDDVANRQQNRRIEILVDTR